MGYFQNTRSHHKKKVNGMAYSKTGKQSTIVRSYLNIILFLETYIGPLLFFFIRIWMAQIFWYSGLSKIQTWDTTILLFQNEYKVPLLSPEIAAYLAAGTELSCPILLVIGFAARLAVIPMLIMTAVIQSTYQCSYEHLYWAILLGFILCYGPNKISVDYFFRRKRNKKSF
jgi:putative oxidoreductase